MNTARILIVEDEQLVARHLKLALEDDGYEVAGVADSAAQALAVAETERPDLVLMDIRIRGDMDGIDTASMLRAELGLPIVFLTANADDPTLQRALQVGPGGFLTKPFNSERVHHAIQVALGQRDSERRIKLENSQLRRESTIDALTGLFNRRHLEQLLERELEFAARGKHPLSIIMLDLDHFNPSTISSDTPRATRYWPGWGACSWGDCASTTCPAAMAATSCWSSYRAQTLRKPRSWQKRCGCRLRWRRSMTACATYPASPHPWASQVIRSMV
jgi:CheY-like chemotaxis protein